MSLALLMTFSTYDPFNKSVPPVHSLVRANLGNRQFVRVHEFLILTGFSALFAQHEDTRQQCQYLQVQIKI